MNSFIPTMSNRKTKWSDGYVQYGFTCIKECDGTPRLQCIICSTKLRNSSLVPTKLKEHSATHKEGNKNTTFAEFKVRIGTCQGEAAHFPNCISNLQWVFFYEIQILLVLLLNTAILCEIDVLLILCTNKYTPNIIFVFLIVRGSAKAPMKVQGFGTPKKVKNYCFSIFQ